MAKSGYGGAGEKEIDAILDKMQNSMEQMEALQGKMVKLRNAETECLKAFEAARDIMLEMLSKPDPGRELLQNIFGGDCVRIARIRLCLDTAKFSDGNAKDQRINGCNEAATSVEKVLEDLGLGAALRAAMEAEKDKKARRKSTVTAEQIEAVTAEVEEPVVEEPVIEEPVVEEPPREPTPPPREPTPEVVQEEVAVCEFEEFDLAQLADMTPPDKSDLGNWMIWMVHRAHLDDPTLEKFDFTNLKMPAANEEPRIAPKLAKAMAKNTHITHLLLPNTNLGAKEGGELAASLAQNKTLKVLNVDSNFLHQDEMESLANACGVNQTLEEVRVNNQHGLMLGRSSFEAWSNAVKANKFICKLGLNITDPHYRNEIDRSIMRNNDDARKRRVEAKKAAEAAAKA